MYQEIYWQDLDDMQREMNRLHNEHCIGMGYLVSRCQELPKSLLWDFRLPATSGDVSWRYWTNVTSLTRGDKNHRRRLTTMCSTFEWNQNEKIPVANATTHQCVNWNKLDEWTKDRSVDMMAPGWLVHPTLGK